MPRNLALCFLVVLVVVAIAPGCAHGDVLQGGVLHKGDLRVELGPVPSSWRRVEVDGADLAFRDDARDGSALFDVRCRGRDDDAPLAILTQNLIMGTTDRDFESQEVVPFDRREAMHTRLRAKLDGVPMQYDIYVMKKDGCLYDLVFVAPPDHFVEGAADFGRFVAGTHTHSSSTSAESAPLSGRGDP
jgi:hypothetical protein